MNNATTLHRGTTVTTGSAHRMMADTYLISAYLAASGGTATCNVYGRISAEAPWGTTPLVTFGLSGANDRAQYLLNEPWFEIKADISAIASATATITAGY